MTATVDWATDPRVTIAERDEGQWFAYLGNEMDGPYPDAAEAQAALPPTNPARGPYCGCGLYGDHDEKHGDPLGSDEMSESELLRNALTRVARDIAEAVETRAELAREATKQGWTLRQIGEVLGVSHATVANILKGADR
jgi:Homeodomain-like domain